MKGKLIFFSQKSCVCKCVFYEVLNFKFFDDFCLIQLDDLTV